MRIIGLKTALCLVGLLSAVSCGPADPTSPASPSIYGAWGAESFDPDSGVLIYTRLESLTGNRGGYEFGLRGSLLVRNFGWCGTPPYSYANFEGAWQQEQDHVLTLSYFELFDIQDFRLEILELTASELHFRLERVE